MKKLSPPCNDGKYRAAFLLAVSSLLVLLLTGNFFAASAATAKAPVVADLQKFPQDASAYLPKNPDTPIVDAESQRAGAEEYLQKQYAPWHNVDLSYLDLSMDKVLEYHKATAKKQYFTGDGKPFPAASMRKITENGVIDQEDVPRPGVTVAEANVRVLPTSNPLYPSAVSAKGERGLLKMDVLQNSALKPAEPLAVYAQSKDGLWYFIATDSVVGWVRSHKVAFVDGAFMDRFQRAAHRVVVKDNVHVRNDKKEVAATIKMGAVIPAEGEDLLLPVRGQSGLAEIKKFSPERGVALPFPVAFTPRNAVRAVGQVMGEPYGWGGTNGFRDCSAMTRDYFSVFGVWLPRNSGDQARMGTSIPLKGVKVGDRAKTIAADGIPFATLIHMPGHIMLYVGTRDGVPVVIHNVWGVRRNMADGKVGRVVIGRTVATSLRAGAEIENRPKSSLFIDNIAAIVFPAAEVE